MDSKIKPGQTIKIGANYYYVRNITSEKIFLYNQNGDEFEGINSKDLEFTLKDFKSFCRYEYLNK